MYLRVTVVNVNLCEKMDLFSLKQKLISGNRKALSKAITLIESELPEKQRLAYELLHSLSDEPKPTTKRIGITGPPGVGKSTFIENFGLFLIEKGLKIAVIAVDPSSKRSGGSILGDKMRMNRLASSPNSYIRPVPSGNNLGGVSSATLNIMSLLEHSNFDVILVETVGVGQSETNVYDLTDMFVHLYNPVSGDEMQGIKRGIMELSDLFLITKADGDTLDEALLTEQKLKIALSFLHTTYKDWKPPILRTSALSQLNFTTIWDLICAFFTSEERRYIALNRRKKALYTQCFKNLSDSIITKIISKFGERNDINLLINQMSYGLYNEQQIADKIILDFVTHYSDQGQATK